MNSDDVAVLERQGHEFLVAGRFAEAEGCFMRALGLNPNSFESLIQMGRKMLSGQNLSAAEIYFNRALKVNPRSFEARMTWASALFRFGNLSQAEGEARRALEADPMSPGAHELLGNILSQKGDTEAAVSEFGTSIALVSQPSASAYQGFVSNKRITEADRPLVEKMMAALNHGLPNLRSQLVMEVSLGKALDDLGDYEACLYHFNIARKLARQQEMGRSFSRQQTASDVGMMKRTFPASVFERPKTGLDTELPVLIVGLPRAGSTLLEQILSCHPQVAGAGEIDWWRSSPVAMEPRKVFDLNLAAQESLKYRQTLRSLGPTKKRVIDKTLPNYGILGPLHLMFPNARIIHCRRHPIDTCLSILMNTLLLNDPPSYVFD